jgi:hypothetical protein
MEVTQETLREMILEVLTDISSHLENSSGTPRGAYMIGKDAGYDLDTVGMMLSLPGVLYSDNPMTNDNAEARVYVQLPYAVLKDALDAMTAATTAATKATEGVDEAVESATTAAESANNAAESATTAAEAANSAAQSADSSRQQIESNETTRQQNEQRRVTAEQQRAATASNDHTRAEADHQTASSDHQTATADHTQSTADHDALAAALTGAGNVNAQLDGITVTITNRSGQSKSVDIGFDIYKTYTSVAAMNVDASNVPLGKFVIIATTDKTSEDNARMYIKSSQGNFRFLCDLDQASAEAWADWLDTWKPAIESRLTQADNDHTQAVSDHATAASDHQAAEADHQTAVTDHEQAVTDHTRADSDHTTATTDHEQAATDHTRADSDHEQAVTDHTRADSDHEQATTDHTQADADHAAATTDHQTASSDHQTATADHTQADADHKASVTATNNANANAQLAYDQATYAENVASHPSYIADGSEDKPGDVGFVYQWDYAAQQYVRGNRIALDWSTMTQDEKDALAAEVLANISFDDVPTPGSNKAVRSSGIAQAIAEVLAAIPTITAEERTAMQSGITQMLVEKLKALPTNSELETLLDGKQDTLTMASVETCVSLVGELV